MQEEVQKHKIGVHPPKIHPKITSIGYGNPRYNSMVSYKSGILISSGSHLRWVNFAQDKVLMDRQIGYCQIFQIMENTASILVINYDGLITILDKDTLNQTHQFYAPGKEIRHATFTDKYLAVSCELNNDSEDSLLLSYRIEDIHKGKYEPIFSKRGHFYFPEYLEDQLTVLEYKDPNPKGRKRKETVMQQKLPITNQITKFDKDFNVVFKYLIKEEGEIICCCLNKGIAYYLHSTKKMTVVDIKQQKTVEFGLATKSFPHLLETYKDGVVYAFSANTLEYVRCDFQQSVPVKELMEIKTMAIGGNMALKCAEDGIYGLNQNGIHFYSYELKKTFSKSIFSITNCGITFNQTGDMFAVADFGGSFFIFNTSTQSGEPEPLFTVFIGIPIRTIVWCPSTNNIVIGCVGGSLFWWKFGSTQAEQVLQIDNTFNILRAVEEKIYAGSSDGVVKIFESKTMALLGEYKAHHPIHYETQEQRELFGSMKNYAEIWSLTIPKNKQQLFIVSSCEDQTQKVYKANLQSNNYELIHHLKGHELAVTSIDWKLMNEQLGQVYVSCSDDKIIRFRDPQNHFKILFQLETSTIKQWHTLTYLSLEPKGHRVAIGSQNGYLFIYDIEKKDLLFGEKIHLGGIQGLDWVGNKICTCSSDLCINILEV